MGPGKNTLYAMILDSICSQNEFIEAMLVALASKFLVNESRQQYSAMGAAIFAKPG